MKSCIAALMLALVGLGCRAVPRGPAADAPRTQVAPEAVDGFVLLWFDTAFHRAPDDPAPMRAYDFGDTPRQRRPGHFFVMQVLETDGPWVKVVDPVKWLREDGTSLHCMGSGAFWVQHFAIELWVNQADLVPVLTQRFNKGFEDGTFVDLRPGTPVIDGRPWAMGYQFPIDVPKASIGDHYHPANQTSPRADGGFKMLNAHPKRFALGGAAVPWSQEITDYAKAPFLRLNPDHSRAYETGGCGHFELSFEGEVVPGPNGGLLGGIGGASKTVPGIEIPKGTALFWPGGGRAGSVLKRFQRADATASKGPLTCLKVPLGTNLKTTGYQEATVTVCVKSSAVRAVQTPAAMSKAFRSAGNSVEVLP